MNPNTGVQCPTLDPPSNGGLEIAGPGGYEVVATYSCDTGFSLVGMSERSCQSDGTWSGSEPTCEVRMIMFKLSCLKPFPHSVNVCPTLVPPANGNLVLSGNTFGETAGYTCNTGFILEGDSTLTCGGDGQWSGSPTCLQP